MDAGSGIEDPLDWIEDRVQPGTAALEDGRQVRADGLCQDQDKKEVQADLQPSIRGHQNFSGRSKAKTR
jgi:hypothetical protein